MQASSGSRLHRLCYTMAVPVGSGVCMLLRDCQRMDQVTRTLAGRDCMCGSGSTHCTLYTPLPLLYSPLPLLIPPPPPPSVHAQTLQIIPIEHT